MTLGAKKKRSRVVVALLTPFLVLAWFVGLCLSSGKRSKKGADTKSKQAAAPTSTGRLVPLLAVSEEATNASK